WGVERVDALLAQIRLYGEKPELKQEVVELANEFNLVTPYTSMYVPTSAELAREKEDAGQQTAFAFTQEAPRPMVVRRSGPVASPQAGGGTGSGSGGGIGPGQGSGVGPGHGYNTGAGAPATASAARVDWRP